MRHVGYVVFSTNDCGKIITLDAAESQIQVAR